MGANNQPDDRSSMAVCSYEFGQGLGAEGICTERFAKAMLEQGWRLTVATSVRAQPTLSHDHLRVVRFSDWPGTGRISHFLANKLQVYFENNCAWRWRVLRAKPGRTARFIYGRGVPFTGLLAAAALARRLNKPYGLHFGDPFPSPWDRRDRVFSAKSAAAAVLIRDCAFLTFVTAEALQYVEEKCRLSLREKAFLLPHIAPDPIIWPRAADDRIAFLYAGRFYGKRRPDILLQGFGLFLSENPEAEFRYFGPDVDWVERVGRELRLGHRLTAAPYTDRIWDHFAAAQVLVATDATEDHPLCLPTKIIEYLSTNRKVLLISPSDSPASRLVARVPETALHVLEDPQTIAHAMRRLARLDPSEADFAKRRMEMSSYSPVSISKAFLRGIPPHLKSDPA
jgi:glycosyltransferase involved in cell wall biosynthesis